MPDRIIDTNAIMMKKSKQTVKDLKELKDARVDFNEGGINVRVRGDWKDYSIPFDMDGYSAEQKKKFLASTYETFEQQERQTRNETSQAVLAELKKLTCKLAGMTEEEMQRYLKKKYEGKGVMYRIEHAAEVYNKAKQHYRMELGNTFSDSKEHFDAVRDRAVEEKGIVMPNLNKEKVKVVEVEKHGFGENKADAIKNARIWAKDNLATKNGDMPTMRDGTPYIISKAAIDKYLSNSAISKSEDPFVHLSVLPKLTDVIHESIEAEIHPDYKKGEDGLRSVENGYGEGVLVHRLYGAVEIGGKMYRVKTTMQEFRGGEENKPHSYEVTKIELLDSPGKRENPDRPPLVSSNNSIDTAKLLQGVEKSYDSGKKLLDESKDLTDGETLFRKEEGKSGDASLGLSKPTEPERKPDGRIVPADVDKKVVSEIEEKFEKKLSELVNLAKTEEDKAKIREHVRNEIIEFSRLTKTEIENERKNIQRDLGNVLDDRAKIRSEKILSATGAAFAADRELEYRRVRAGRLRESFGLQAGTETRADEIERLYKEVLARETGLPREDREKLEALAGRCSNLSMRLGVAFKNIDVPKERGLFGMSSSGRTIDYYIDTMVRTSTNTQRELATTLLHEMIHQATAGTLYLAEKGLGKEWLTEKQRKATDTIFEIYNKVSKDPKRFAESPYGLEDAYELTAQMADPLQRKAMDKFETIVAALRKRGDSDSRNLWQRFKDAIKALFEISDKDKMDKAINYILDDFNQSIDDAAMRMWEEEISPEGDKPRYASLSLTEPLEGRIAETVEKVSKQTGGKVKMVNSVEEIGNEQVRRDIENGKQVTGWYDEAIVQSYI